MSGSPIPGRACSTSKNSQVPGARHYRPNANPAPPKKFMREAKQVVSTPEARNARKTSSHEEAGRHATLNAHRRTHEP
ncbi:MAG: hypothetical protein ACLR7Z_13255 [Bilophila wadsworthia]